MVWLIAGIALYVAIGLILVGMVADSKSTALGLFFVVLLWPPLVCIGIGFAFRKED